MKNKICTFILCLTLLFSFVSTSGCSNKKLKGTSLAEALLAKERINHEHLTNSFDFLEDRLNETELLSSSSNAGSIHGEIISGSGDTAVYSWSKFHQLVKELHYFQSHFSAGQSRTVQVDQNISYLENKTDIKDKWVTQISFIHYLMQVEENREIIYANDEYNENYSVGIRTVNDEVNTTYEYYENQGDNQIRTLATPNRRYEYTTINGAEVLAFVADNDNGYWRFTQFDSSGGKNFSINIMVMTDELAYAFRYIINESNSYYSTVTLLSPDLKYEIAYLNGNEITIYPGSYTGINELRVSQEEQKNLGEFGEIVGYSKDYGYYSTYAAPHIYTNSGVISAPTPIEYDTIPTVLDENVSYSDGNVRGLWEFVYPELTFKVQGENIYEYFDNLHNALSKYGIEPIYDKTKVAQMMTDVFKLVEGYTNHYSWNGLILSSLKNAIDAYEREKAKVTKYEDLFANAKTLPTATKQDLVEAKQNLGFPDLSFNGDANVSVENAKITIDGVSATVKKDNVLEEGQSYVLKLALKKNTENLEELIVLDNLLDDSVALYSNNNLTLTLDGQFNLPTDVSAGSYDLVSYVATKDEGIRVSKFKRVLCVGEVNDEVYLSDIKIHTTITSDKVLNSTYSNRYDVTISLTQNATPYSYNDLVGVLENAVLNNGYFALNAKIERYDKNTETGTPISESDQIEVGTYRLEYLAKADGGEIKAFIYCDVT